MAWQRRDAGNSELDLEEERHLGYSFFGEVVGLPKRIPYRELKEATRNFQTPIGRGGSGSVFKGILGDGLPVAVKRIEGELRGEREFRSEITAILSVQHVSLVRIVGYCIIPRSYRFLVYEYFENGSLDNWIFPKAGRENNCLNWALRYQVAIDVAKALAYLHHQCRQRILHLDVKPENILVDENFRAHVTDFGISRLLGADEKSVITTVRGTRGYLAPEWFLGGGICEKSDVYGYGMNASEKMKGGNLMELVDQRLIGSGDVKEEEVKTLVYVAFWCIQEKPELRPSMEMVANMLQGYVAVGMPPDTKIFLAETPRPPTWSVAPVQLWLVVLLRMELNGLPYRCPHFLHLISSVVKRSPYSLPHLKDQINVPHAHHHHQKIVPFCCFRSSNHLQRVKSKSG
uniref:non-specific serine/threonine protein kinase n=1 Tax=Ananas comosus var. bracteatus TaxID=296719 RepID=A0A6V7QIK9_ANACO|nr:unnamed protein product [Ananas comosus var. bracteatus]